MTLKKKILLGYGVAFVLMGLVVVWFIANLVSLGKASEAILSENYRSILAARNMVDALKRQDEGILLNYLEKQEVATDRFRESEIVFLEWLARAKDNITIHGEEELVKAIETDYTIYRQKFFKWADTQNRNNHPITYSSYKESINPHFKRVCEACISLLKLNEETMYSASLKAKNVAEQAIWSTAFVAGLALVVALIFSLVLAEKLVQPIRRFMEASRKISKGDYTVQVPVETNDELGKLAREFNEMAIKLLRYHELNIEQIISEKNKGEAILSSIEDGLVVFDINLKVTGINPAASEILGVKLEEPGLLRCSDIIPESNIWDLIQAAVDGGIHQKIPDEQRIVELTSGNRTRHYFFSVTTIRGRDHRLSGIVLVLRDVTRLKEVEQLKSEFVMAASHELRTPLTGLGMSIDLLLEHALIVLPKKDQELLKTAHEEVHRMKALVNDLLDLSKIEDGNIKMEYNNLHVITLFEHVRKVFQSQLAMKRVEMTTEIPKELPRVRADANKITWVLTNLVSNALRYVVHDGLIQLKANRIGPNIHLSVQNDGPGIPKEYHTKIFQKFVQVKGRKAGGTGLGLAICKEIVTAHGGAIWVESSQEKGSTFTFTLPIEA